MSDSTGDDETDGPTCRNCGDRIEDESSHRVVTAVEDDEAVHRHFCSEDCLESWRD